MRRRNFAFSSFPTKQLAKSVRFDGYVSRADRDSALNLIPEGAPFWKYYPKQNTVTPSIRQVKISELPLKRTVDKVIEQANRVEEEQNPGDLIEFKCKKAATKIQSL